ncbi:MAG: hypothetical protein H7Y37_05770 [Anaerolineae bacterium]|nr:hypothetical protein [Gloeobacterales cyanobacterium ES-bin-313]
MKYAKFCCLSALAAAVFVGSIALPSSAFSTITTKQSYFTHSTRESAAFTTSSVPWVDLYTTSITVPATAGPSYLRARFTAESICDGLGVLGICRVRVVYINGAPIELEPSSGTDYGFDSTSNGSQGSNSQEGHALERTSPTLLPPGTYRVIVQVSVDDPLVYFTVDDWHLTLELHAP